MEDIYGVNSKYDLNRSIQSALTEGKISSDDRDIILAYVTERDANFGISSARKKKLVSTIIGWQVLFRTTDELGNLVRMPIRDLSLFDIHRGLEKLRSGKSPKGKPYARNTIHDYIVIGKAFWKWLIANNVVNLDLAKISMIKSPTQDTNTTEAYELLTEDEILALINNSRFSRNKAIISLLYESGCRIGELATLKWRDIVIDQYGVKVYITDHKEKGRRYVRCVMSKSYVAQWKDDYRQYGEFGLDSNVFISIRMQHPLEYYGYIRILEKAKEDANIEKKITPHLFRKSRITHMVAKGFQESVIKRMMWNNLSTKMFDTYVKLSEEDIDTELLDKAGIVRKDEKADPLKPIMCPRCGLQNAPSAQFCNSCGLQISGDVIDQAMEYDQELIMDSLTQLNKKKAMMKESSNKNQNQL
jgi:integrase